MSKNYYPILCWENIASKNKSTSDLLTTKVFAVHDMLKMNDIKAQLYTLKEIIRILDNAPIKKTETFYCEHQHYDLVEI